MIKEKVVDRLSVIFGGIILACFAGYLFHMWLGYHLSFKPVVNQNPNNFVLLRGEVDSSLVNKLNLIWSVNYITKNPGCRKTSNWLEGASYQISKTEKINSLVSSRGEYSTKIPTRKYFPGKCQWEEQGVYLTIRDSQANKVLIDQMPIIDLAKGESVGSQVRNDTLVWEYIIKNKKPDIKLNWTRNLDYPLYFNPKQNHQLSLNIIVSRNT